MIYSAFLSPIIVSSFTLMLCAEFMVAVALQWKDDNDRTATSLALTLQLMYWMKSIVWS